MTSRIVVCGAGVVGASVAYFLSRRGAKPLIVDRARPGAAASGKAAGFLALDWNAGNPMDGLARLSFRLHAEIAEDLGADRLAYRRTDALMTAAADEGDLERYRGLPNPDWLDGNVVAHEVIGDTQSTAQVHPRLFTEALVEEVVSEGGRLEIGTVDGLEFDGASGAVSGVSIDGEVTPADVVVLALGPWTSQAQRWLALPQVFGSKGASIVLEAEVPGQVVFSEFFDREGQRRTVEIYPRGDGTVYLNGYGENDPLPDDPDVIEPGDAAWKELQRIAGVHSSVLGSAQLVRKAACYRPLTIDGVPLIGPVPDSPGAYLATAHASWGILLSPATGLVVSEMILDGGSQSLDASPFSLSRLPSGKIAPA
jgi:glycine/D-amino acid oxidase-like deaminating enzyme